MNAFPGELSSGEIHFLWWFIQGSIMNLHTRRKLWRAWGLCERHAWAFVTVEAAFRHGWLLGPAVLYQDLMQRALAAFPLRGFPGGLALLLTLRDKGPCLMCQAGFGPGSGGSAAPGLVARGRDLTEIRTLAGRTRRHWEGWVCGRCAGSRSSHRCRGHLLGDIRRASPGDLAGNRALVAEITDRINVYARSFRFEYHGTATEKDIAALVGAVGWCSGWGTFLALTGDD